MFGFFLVLQCKPIMDKDSPGFRGGGGGGGGPGQPHCS